MTRNARAGLGAALFLPVALVVAACGGTSSTVPTPTPVGNGNGQATPPAGQATPPAGQATPPGVGAIPSFDLGAFTGAIPGLDSYQTEVVVDGKKQYSSVVVTQPVLSKAITTYNDDGSVDTRFIVIGKEVWSAEGADGDFTSIPEALAGPMLLFLDPSAMVGMYAALDWQRAATNVGTEDKNGVQAHHIKIDASSVGGLGIPMPAGASIDVWIADAGYPVAYEMSGFDDDDQNMAIQVTNVNDAANKVERPG
jgi:LppX_LprAFG lipoprotein